jgi:hypothetical protein
MPAAQLLGVVQHGLESSLEVAPAVERQNRRALLSEFRSVLSISRETPPK